MFISRTTVSVASKYSTTYVWRAAIKTIANRTAVFKTMNQQAIVNPINPDVLPKLDPVFVNWYNKTLALIPPQAPDLAALRKVFSKQGSALAASAPTCAKEYDEEIDGWEKYPGKVKIRLYVPQGAPPAAGWPVHINFHGGGWAVGDLDTDVHTLRHICTAASVVLIDVDYRLLPDFPFPTAIYDGFSVLKTVHTSPTFAKSHNLNSTSISLGGVSAGANIALVLNHLARDHEPPIPIKAVTTVTPTLSDISKLSTPQESPYPSMSEFEFTPTLNWKPLKWFDNLKTQSIVKDSPDAQKDLSWFLDAFTAPSYKGLAGLTYIATAGCDPLRDEGEAYARLLEEHGNRVVLRRFEGVPHPLSRMDAILVQAKEYTEDACRYVKAAHYGE